MRRVARIVPISILRYREPPLVDRAQQPAPRLSRLDLHGFKSFATRTVLVFEPGITAIVGPNGSGKSNIADAVRWVLGETSYSALRSRKTEDVIFAGGKGRAPSGMAEVTLTFNNEEGWLPSEFTEVTVTRRAFRGGENQYFLNGRRVRLKDVTQLTAALGQSYTVVGQGLVDAALSQRAEERRGLFEHAADLAGLRLKVIEAERNLTEAEANSARLSDLLAELQPRLKTLERAARQAREWQSLSQRLRFLRFGLYRRTLISAHRDLAEAQDRVAEEEKTLEHLRSTLDAKLAERIAARDHARTASEALAQHNARLDIVREQSRRAGHERDLLDERLAALNRRRTDMLETRAGLEDQVAKARADLARAHANLATARREAASAHVEIDRLETDHRDARKRLAELENEAATLTRAIGRDERTTTDLGQQLALLDQQRRRSGDDNTRLQRESEDRTRQLAQLIAEQEAFETEDARIGEEIASRDARLAEIAAASSEQEAAIAIADRAVDDAERRHGQASNRLAVLQRLQDEGAGLHVGVRHVMQWRREGVIEGIRGTVAELLEVDATFDTAIEVALGGHVQDIVVDRWRNAEIAIERLKSSRAGRATFQPLDTLSRRDQRPLSPSILRHSGVHGVAAELVRCDPDLDVVARALLGRTVVVDDLPTARRLLGDLPTGWSVVTLTGEIARSGGSVTGGSAIRESGVLGRERDLRELPREIARLLTYVDEQRAHRDDAVTTGRRLNNERATFTAERAGLIAQRKERQGERSRLDGWIASLRAQEQQANARAASLTANRTAVESELLKIESDRETLLLSLERSREQLAACQDRLSGLRDELSESTDQLMSARQHLATLDERTRAEERQVTALERQRLGQDEELAIRDQRLSEIDGELVALANRRERLERDVIALTATHETVVAERIPLERAVTIAEEWATTLTGGIERSREDVATQERLAHQGNLNLERARADLETIRRRVTDDLEFADPDELLTAASPETPDGWVLTEDGEAEREIERLRDRLRRVGFVSENVVEEFEQESAHLSHLSAQHADVAASAKAIRAMLADLHDAMQQQFEETFARVAAAFSEAFATLFGGGTARLVLNADDETGAPGGIDIVAQPPGKRLQGLALLSGGERALTAVALLFAILRVNPTPFVLLDEVDAALDEANVVRFRDELRNLGHRTQAIVITHNRGTVEIADTLYGVTMGGDGVSQTLSLRLSDLPLDEEIDIRDIPSISAGIPVR